MKEEEREKIVEKIKLCDEKLGYLLPRHREIAAILSDLDHEVMSLFNKKWALEKLIANVVYLSPTAGLKVHKVKGAKKVDISKMSKEQAEELLSLVEGLGDKNDKRLGIH